MQPDASRPCFEPLGRLDVTDVFPIPPPAAVTFPPSPLGQGHLILKSGLYLRLAVLFLYLPLLLEMDSNPREATNKSGVGQRVPFQTITASRAKGAMGRREAFPFACVVHSEGGSEVSGKGFHKSEYWKRRGNLG